MSTSQRSLNKNIAIIYNAEYAKYLSTLKTNQPLPPGFDRWWLCDRMGWTLAHEAAKRNLLPESFNQWGMTDNNGFTIEEVWENFRNIPIEYIKEK